MDFRKSLGMLQIKLVSYSIMKGRKFWIVRPLWVLFATELTYHKTRCFNDEDFPLKTYLQVYYGSGDLSEYTSKRGNEKMMKQII